MAEVAPWEFCLQVMSLLRGEINGKIGEVVRFLSCGPEEYEPIHRPHLLTHSAKRTDPQLVGQVRVDVELSRSMQSRCKCVQACPCAVGSVFLRTAQTVLV